eukprot:362839-Chlamydomonas_euryale.AAC.1
MPRYVQPIGMPRYVQSDTNPNQSKLKIGLLLRPTAIGSLGMPAFKLPIISTPRPAPARTTALSTPHTHSTPASLNKRRPLVALPLLLRAAAAATAPGTAASTAKRPQQRMQLCEVREACASRGHRGLRCSANSRGTCILTHASNPCQPPPVRASHLPSAPAAS